MLSATQSAADLFQHSDSTHYFALYAIDGETCCMQKWHKCYCVFDFTFQSIPNDRNLKKNDDFKYMMYPNSMFDTFFFFSGTDTSGAWGSVVVKALRY